ncbi:hypothetical protein HWC44_gp047 [Mycobacterium phage ThetaBob]|uniref:Uncharacterized protein n=1 Tax=Mycobacterium phage ThetaBob TaxID=2588513 RepID=A0A4Y6EML3_9CAUD|nr:hypothetical protein HWC44_gp047 [Mycobacterium phage ThetaBob]QDF19933.1 hypothetical protein SEA_THETABOB_47 [Mycobacterium phage ThetaBob]
MLCHGLHCTRNCQREHAYRVYPYCWRDTSDLRKHLHCQHRSCKTCGLIIRWSWVRAPPAPPAQSLFRFPSLSTSLHTIAKLHTRHLRYVYTVRTDVDLQQQLSTSVNACVRKKLAARLELADTHPHTQFPSLAHPTHSTGNVAGQDHSPCRINQNTQKPFTRKINWPRYDYTRRGTNHLATPAFTPGGEHTMLDGARDTTTEEQQRILNQIRAAFDYIPDNPKAKDGLRPWLGWQAEHMVPQLSSDDFTESELMALVGLLGPVFARTFACTLPGPQGRERPTLRAVI